VLVVKHRIIAGKALNKVLDMAWASINPPDYIGCTTRNNLPKPATFIFKEQVLTDKKCQNLNH
jgi:hypothetical protein